MTVILYEVFNYKDEMGPKAPDMKSIRVTVWADKYGWVKTVFNKELALQHAAEMKRLGDLL